MDRTALIAMIDQLQATHKIPDTTIGLGAVNDANFVRRLRGGRRVWPETAAKVVSYIHRMSAIQSVRTQDGTVIVFDPVTKTSASGRTLADALAELRRLLTAKEAA